MAIAIYGNIITDLKGSVGGWTFQHNGAGKIVRQKPYQLKNPTPRQTTEESNLFQNLGDYTALSFANKNLWFAFAGLHTKTNLFGEVKTLSGQNWYVSINENLQRIGQAITPTPPTYTLPPAVTNYTLALANTLMRIQFTAPFDSPNSYLVIRATQPIKKSNGNLRSDWRIISILSPATFSTIQIKSDWNTYFGLDYESINTDGKFIIATMLSTIEMTSGQESVGSIVIAARNL